jgi:hypothetical protein
MSPFVAIATSSLIAISALPVAAQPQAPGPRSSIVNQALTTQAKQKALTTIQGNALDSSNKRRTTPARNWRTTARPHLQVLPFDK